VANSGSSGGDPGLDVESNGGGALTIKIDNNQMYQWGSNGAGFYVQVGQTFGNPTNVNVTATNNTIAQPGTFSVTNNAQGFQLNNGTGSGDAPTTCLLFSGNTVDQAGTGAGGDVRLRQRFDSKVNMPGYTGPQDGTTGSPTVAHLHSGAEPHRSPNGHFYQFNSRWWWLLQHSGWRTVRSSKLSISLQFGRSTSFG
jgi:hypothetical protein